LGVARPASQACHLSYNASLCLHPACAVEEIVVIWSGAPPPDLSAEFPAGEQKPRVRIRQEPFDSLNNRFRPDPLLQTRAALQLDDDVIMRWGLEQGRGAGGCRQAGRGSTASSLRLAGQTVCAGT
jgi:hypothetical protein